MGTPGLTPLVTPIFISTRFVLPTLIQDFTILMPITIPRDAGWAGGTFRDSGMDTAR